MRLCRSTSHIPCVVCSKALRSRSLLSRSCVSFSLKGETSVVVTSITGLGLLYSIRLARICHQNQALPSGEIRWVYGLT